MAVKPLRFELPWAYEVHRTIHNDPVFALYLGREDGKLYALCMKRAVKNSAAPWFVAIDYHPNSLLYREGIYDFPDAERARVCLETVFADKDLIKIVDITESDLIARSIEALRDEDPNYAWDVKHHHKDMIPEEYTNVFDLQGWIDRHNEEIRRRGGE